MASLPELDYNLRKKKKKKKQPGSLLRSRSMSKLRLYDGSTTSKKLQRSRSVTKLTMHGIKEKNTKSRSVSRLRQPDNYQSGFDTMQGLYYQHYSVKYMQRLGIIPFKKPSKNKAKKKLSKTRKKLKIKMDNQEPKSSHMMTTPFTKKSSIENIETLPLTKTYFKRGGPSPGRI